MDKLIACVKNNRAIFFGASLFVLLNIFAVHANAALVWGTGLWGEVWDDVDTDGDGLTDSEETNIYHTNPLSADTDHDTLPDGWEVAHGRNPLVADYQVVTGGRHVCVIVNSALQCWGDDSSGQTNVPSLNHPVSVALNGSHTCALDDNGMHCWGDNYYGQRDVPALINPKQISTGVYTSCAIDDNGAHCWGANFFGEINVPALVNPVQISAGFSHTCALDDNGVHCWGFSGAMVTQVPSLVNPVSVTAGDWHACALDDNGVHCWGDDTNGAIEVPSLTNPRQVSAGTWHTCALDDNGVHCWGNNDYGQTNVPTLAHPVSVSAGWGQTCALDDFGVHCWGYNNDGQTNVPALMIDPDGDGVSDSQDCYPLDNTKACSPGTYPSGGGIAQAPAGSYAINGVLSQCAVGTYQPLTGQSSCNADTTCTATQFESVAPTTTSDRVCAARKPNDFDVNGKSDVLLRNTSTGDFNLAQLNGLTILNQGSLSGALTDPDNIIVSTADFNGDGTADILTRGDVNGLIPGAFHIDLMSGPNVIDSNWLLTMSQDLNDEVMSTKDFNKDGKADVLLRNKVSGVWTINYMNGTSDPTINTLNATLDTCYTLQGDGDYDGNGYPDLLLRKNHCGGGSYPWLMYTTNGTPTVLASGTLPGVATSANWGAVTTDKDFDGDGKADLLVRFLTGITQQWVLYNLNGVGAPSANGLVNIALQSQWQFAAEGDFNADGKADLLLRNTNNGQWYIYLLNNTAVLSGAVPNVLINPLWTLQGTDDYDGDGKSDILIRNISSGQWYMNLVNGTAVQSKGLLTINSDLSYVLQND